jgi:hypothetical protein
MVFCKGDDEIGTVAKALVKVDVLDRLQGLRQWLCAARGQARSHEAQ